MEEIDERPNKSAKFQPRQIKSHHNSNTTNSSNPLLDKHKPLGFQSKRKYDSPKNPLPHHQQQGQSYQKQLFNKETTNIQPSYPRKLMPMPTPAYSSNVNMTKANTQNRLQQRSLNQR